MKIGLVTIAYRLPLATLRLLTSAVSEEHEVETHLFQHSDDPDVAAICELFGPRDDVTLYPYGVNRGLSKSWNEGMLAAYDNGCDVVIIVNDDCVFRPGDLDTLAGFAVQHRDKYINPAWGYNERLGRRGSLGYSCFAINPVALEEIGCFDENIFPIYFEDCDYGIRAKLAGLELKDCEMTDIRHGGSATIHSSPMVMAQHQRTFNANRDYFLRKWGGEPGKEKFESPFDDGRFGLKIKPEKRSAPYGERYDRSDFDELVKI